MRYLYIKRKHLFGILLTCSSMLLALVVLRSSVGAIARGYQTNDAGLQTGMVVALSLDPEATDTVERATQASSDRVVGVVTTLDNSLVTVTSGKSKVLVESEGNVDSYVSDMNGTVKKGDLLVLSPLKGILMKGSASTGMTIIALAADSPTAVTSTYAYQVAGQTKQTAIAKVRVNLNQTGSRSNGTVVSNSALAQLGRSIVGKDVGEARVVIAMVIFFIVLIAEGTILYGAISTAITALGRNPLARKIIRGELFRVIVVALLVLCVGLGAVYGILWI